MAYEVTVASDPVETTVYTGDANVLNANRANIIVIEQIRTTITTTVTTYDSETDEQIGDPVVTETISDVPTGNRKRFILNIKDFTTIIATERNARLAELGQRIRTWIDVQEAADVVDNFLEDKLATFLATL